MNEQLALVTGGTRGIGLAVATGLAARGIEVIIVGSNRDQGLRATATINLRYPGRAQFEQADFTSIASVKALASRLLTSRQALHYLIHNAAVVTARYQQTKDGFETQTMVNHLVPYLLTQQLMPLLIRAPMGNIVITASQVEEGAYIDTTNLGYQQPYHGARVYASTKLANLMFTYALSRRLSLPLRVNALHPGVVRTFLLDQLLSESQPSSALGLMRAAAGSLLRTIGLRKPVKDWALTPEQGAMTTLAVALDPQLLGVSGQYFSNLRSRTSSARSRDLEQQESLWQTSARLLDVAADWPQATS